MTSREKMSLDEPSRSCSVTEQGLVDAGNFLFEKKKNCICTFHDGAKKKKKKELISYAITCTLLSHLYKVGFL